MQRIFHNKLIKGELDKIEYERRSYRPFRWIYDFAIIRHAHYALAWGFNTNDNIEDFALYSLLINRHDSKAMEVIDKQKKYFSNLLTMIRPEWLPSASEEMCKFLLELFPTSPEINYIVSTWSIGKRNSASYI